MTCLLEADAAPAGSSSASRRMRMTRFTTRGTNP
jgi:hypothetical protein